MYEYTLMYRSWQQLKSEKRKLVLFFILFFTLSFGAGFATSQLFFPQVKNEVLASTQNLSDKTQAPQAASQVAVNAAPSQVVKEYVSVNQSAPYAMPVEKKVIPAESNSSIAKKQDKEPQSQPPSIAAVNASVASAAPVERQSSEEELTLSKYREAPSADTAVAVSRYYFDAREYEKAKKWALEANAIDLKNEQSWILFARSSFRLGHKNDAIKALESYTQDYNSKEAKQWLAKMKSSQASSEKSSKKQR